MTSREDADLFLGAPMASRADEARDDRLGRCPICQGRYTVDETCSVCGVRHLDADRLVDDHGRYELWAHERIARTATATDAAELAGLLEDGGYDHVLTDRSGVTCRFDIEDGRGDWPVHHPYAPDAPIPGTHHYSACDPDRPRVAPDGVCEGCGEKACPTCGHGDPCQCRKAATS
jgi:hypothetical protein